MPFVRKSIIFPQQVYLVVLYGALDSNCHAGYIYIGMKWLCIRFTSVTVQFVKHFIGDIHVPSIKVDGKIGLCWLAWKFRHIFLRSLPARNVHKEALAICFLTAHRCYGIMDWRLEYHPTLVTRSFCLIITLRWASRELI